MSQPTTPSETGPSTLRPFTKAERIQQLNDIDKGITQLLQSAGQALQVLSHSTIEADRTESFKKASNTFLNQLHVVDVGLKRQIWALEEADIIPPEKAKAKVKEPVNFNKNMGGNKATQAAEPPPVEGGMGKLDIGWLNSRSGQVGRDMEAELWEKAKVFLEAVDADGPGKRSADDDGDQVMDI